MKTFVAANLNNVLLATSDAFGLPKMCRNIESVRKIQNSVSDRSGMFSLCTILLISDTCERGGE